MKVTPGNIYPISVGYHDYHMVSLGCTYAQPLADAILSSNLNIPLRGVAIGNGWMDARRQYPAYLEYAVKHGIIELGSDVRTALFDCI